MLRRLLSDLARQDAKGQFTFSVVVADNDPERSAELVVRDCAAASPLAIKYCFEPRRNIALVRNKTLEHSEGDAIAFIDDDEFPVNEWLFNLVSAWRDFNVAGVLGPVRPHYPDGTPAWVRRGGFYDRPEHKTGFVMPWPECRTGNVLLSRPMLQHLDPAFNPGFPNGGEDVDFFRRTMEAGHKFIWCNEAVAYETVPPDRWKRGILLKRALQRGANSLRHSQARRRNILKAVVAIPVYVCALPFLLLAGQHYFMKYLVKTADHAGRLLAACGIQPMRQRQM
jgi:glycosyltransferase involved in cell wall biosynthesis